MSPAVRLFRDRLMRRAAALAPDVRAALLKGFDDLGASLSEAELVRLIESGRLDELLDPSTLGQVFIRLKRVIRDGVEQAGAAIIRDLPKIAQGMQFDVLAPKVIEGIRTLNDRALNTLAQDARETVRAFVENGIRDGVNPRTIARQIRSVVGLAPNQLRAVDNFRRMLEEGDPTALTRALRDRRFDSTLRKAFAGDGLSPDQIEKMTEAYRKRFLAFNAETNARTVALEAQKLAQQSTWQQAIDQGHVDPASLFKRWVGVKDSRERLEHWAMEGETVAWDEHYSNGEMVPGESTFNCRCMSIFTTVRDPSTARQPGAGPAAAA